MASSSFVKYITPKTDKYPNRAYLKVWWESTPIGNNKSNVHVWAKIYRPYTVSSTATKDVELTVAGVKKNSTVPGGWGGKGWTDKIIENTVTVTHDSEGQKKIYIQCAAELTCKFNGTYYSDPVVTSKTLCTLDNLLTKTSISLDKTSCSIGDTVKIKLSRKTSTVRHKITATFDEYSKTILSRSNDNGSTASYDFNLTPSLIDHMSSKSVTVKIACTTYNNLTSLGSITKSFTLSLRDTDRIRITEDMVTFTYAPLYSAHDITEVPVYQWSSVDFKIKIPDSYLPGSYSSKYNRIRRIDGYLNNSTTKNSSITLVDSSDYVSDINNHTNTNFEGSLKNSGFTVLKNDLLKSGDNTLTLYAIDNRGLKSEPLNITVTTYPRNAIIINSATFLRCLENGTIDKTGTNVKFNAEIDFSSINNLNELTIRIYQKLEAEDKSEYKLIDTIKTKSGTISKIYQNYSIDNRYNFKLEIDDRFDTLSNVSYYELGTEDILIDMYKNSVCIGGVSNRESAFEVNLDSYFEGTIYGTVQTNASDMRLKELVDDDLIPLLKIWDEMTVVLYKYKDYNNKIQAGVIAQEIIELFNKHEIDWKKYGIVYQDPYTGYYSINYEFLNQLSILKVKLLQWKLLSIDQRLEKLENK